MGRYTREEVVGGFYHVTARDNNREYIFKKDIDKGYFLKLLNESRQNMRFKLMGYVLMDNHYHLLVQTGDVKLQKIMYQINNKYSKYFNAVYERCGHVFQGRYKSSAVRNEQYNNRKETKPGGDNGRGSRMYRNNRQDNEWK